MHKKILITLNLYTAVSIASLAQSIYPGQHIGKLAKESTTPMQTFCFELKDVRLLPSRFRDNMKRDSAWMTSIDTNRLLHSFRTKCRARGWIYDSKEIRRLGIT